MSSEKRNIMHAKQRIELSVIQLHAVSLTLTFTTSTTDFNTEYRFAIKQRYVVGLGPRWRLLTGAALLCPALPCSGSALYLPTPEPVAPTPFLLLICVIVSVCYCLTILFFFSAALPVCRFRIALWCGCGDRSPPLLYI